MKAKKVLAMLMASAMIMGTSVTAFAAETTNVTVNVGKTYDSFKYIQIVEADPTSTDGWKYVDGYADDFTEIPVGDLINIAKLEGQNEHAIAGEINDTTAYQSSDLAEVLEGLRDDAGISVEEGTSFNATKGGLYVIIPEKENYTYSPTMVYVPVNSEAAISVQAKGASDQVTKEIVNVTEGEFGGEGYVDGDDSVTANDTVEYRVTMKYPYFSDAAKDTTFEITDTLTNGTFLNDLVITVNGSEFSNYTKTGTTENITITFNNYNPTLAGTDVVITYSVKVSANVSATNPFSNKVVSTIGTNKTQSIVKSDTVGVEFDKVNSTGELLTGAVFALYEKGTDTLIAYIADAGVDDTVTLPSEADKTKLVKDGNADGTLTYDKLDANKAYYVQEVVAPDEYSLVDTKFDLVSGGTVTGYPKTETKDDENGISTTTTEYQYNDFTVQDNNEGNGIVNTTLSSLPSTGGIGTTIFTIGGCAIMVTAAGLYFATRKKEQN